MKPELLHRHFFVNVPGHLLSQRPASLKRREAARVYFISCNRKKSEVISSKNLEAKTNTIGLKEPHYYYGILGRYRVHRFVDHITCITFV